MRCPFCTCLETQVKDSRHAEDGSIKRRRFCPECASRFTTYERLQLSDIVVVKKNGTKMPFDRSKMARSIYTALRKRPIESVRIEKLINAIIRRLELLGDQEVPSHIIGEMVIESLKDLDIVAYIRFASVYKDFKNANDFQDFLVTNDPK